MTKLIADIGGTNVRFGIAAGDEIRGIRTLANADHESLADAARAYLKETKEKPDSGAFAIATPLDGTDHVEMTNHTWTFSIKDTARKIGLKNLRVINDFMALACGVPHLAPGDYYQSGGGKALAGMPVGIIGPGTGLGVGLVVFVDGKPVPIATEGGHVTMPATGPREFALFEYLKQQKYHHISAERVISGKGLVNIYDAIVGVDGLDLPEKQPADITEAALQGSCKASAEALELMCHFLGVCAGNLALTTGAGGGIYVAGGIVPQLGDYFKQSRFRESFVAKGRFRDYLERIPTFVVTHPQPGLEGLKHLE